MLLARRWTWVIAGLCSVSAGLQTTGPAQAQDISGVYRDFQDDAEYRGSRPTRVKLVKSGDVELGRVGGVWGTLGAGDEGDSFFLGKTPDAANLKISLTTPIGDPPVRVVIEGKDGDDIDRFEITSIPGESVVEWVSVRGRITADLTPTQGVAASYAFYIWYPGGSVDSLNLAEIREISSGEYAQKPVLFRAAREE